jgi:hypothetical protein
LKIDQPVNSNYAATVVTIKTIVPLDNCDNVVATRLLGYQAIVSKDTVVGTRGILFPPECQLSPAYAKQNNLFRHNLLNVNPEQKGYLEDNRRVKAMRFRGHTSNALFMPLESLAFTKIDFSKLTDGTTFDKLNGFEICRKYIVKTSGVPKEQKNKEAAKFKRVDQVHFPLHFDTDNYWRNVDAINPEKQVTVTAKLHGTSIRVANTIVKRKLTWLEKLAKKLGVNVKEYEYDYVFGSRRVTKDVNNPDQNSFYDEDIWSIAGKQLEGLLPEGFIVYGELIGWTPSGAPIQPNYTYSVPQGEFKLYVYRVAFVNAQGLSVDLSWDQVMEFCRDRGLLHVPELWRGKLLHFKGLVEDYIDERFADLGFDTPQLEHPQLVDEGVCVRVDGLVPYVLKAKSPNFLEHESKLLDNDVIDMESAA